VISFATHTIFVIRPTMTVNAYGDTEPDWTNTTSRAVAKCRVQPMSGNDVITSGTIPRRGTVTHYKLFAPTGTDLHPTDRVHWLTGTFTVSDIQQWQSATGNIAHLEAILTQVEG
jgi:hypothetical protein